MTHNQGNKQITSNHVLIPAESAMGSTRALHRDAGNFPNPIWAIYTLINAWLSCGCMNLCIRSLNQSEIFELEFTQNTLLTLILLVQFERSNLAAETPQQTAQHYFPWHWWTITCRFAILVRESTISCWLESQLSREPCVTPAASELTSPLP